MGCPLVDESASSVMAWLVVEEFGWLVVDDEMSVSSSKVDMDTLEVGTGLVVLNKDSVVLVSALMREMQAISKIVVIVPLLLIMDLVGFTY
jgi:hypothetical protein